ncbi:hypothetical protein VTN49DRAFT_3438 [Thermomyces lanuginosus]|uniref:uncharacterized protein n=1 Tax=Thermomyces lanuginosus TaxID=5541 RepID=UPI003741FCE6
MEDNPELSEFRRQWREEVTRRAKSSSKEPTQGSTQASSQQTPPSKQYDPPIRHPAADRKEDSSFGESSVEHHYDEFVQRTGQLSLHSTSEDSFVQSSRREPRSALEHFERAIEKEAEGKLGDSLDHYRKAYRLDASIDKKYRHKHFASKQVSSAVQQVSAAAPSTAEDRDLLPTSELIQSFANLPIPPAGPLIEGTPPPPCPIAKVPTDILIEILKHVALMDPSAFGRMALVCKRFAYHFAHEQHIWKRLCQGPEFGFESMHYSFSCDLQGNQYHTLGPRYTPFPRGMPVQIPKPLTSWSQVFQMFPRIRFTGVYISTVNYTRPGASTSHSHAVWNSPIHIVTYYRYLRFYPDGTVISLLTTTEPVEVVPYISKENVAEAKAAASRHLHQRQRSEAGAASTSNTTAGTSTGPVIPPVAMNTLKHTLRGRWHLIRPTAAQPEEEAQSVTSQVPPSMKAEGDSEPDPRDVVIETEGVDPKYVYVLHLSLRSSNPARGAGLSQAPPNVSKNTKLIWKGFWSYNKLTDDWAVFGLRNDRSFVFRRVRGWGLP